MSSTTNLSEAGFVNVEIDIEPDETRDAWLDMVSEIIDEEGGIDESGGGEAGAEEVEANEDGEIKAD